MRREGDIAYRFVHPDDFQRNGRGMGLEPLFPHTVAGIPPIDEGALEILRREVDPDRIIICGRPMAAV
jgi:hypothetical protein